MDKHNLIIMASLVAAVSGRRLMAGVREQARVAWNRSRCVSMRCLSSSTASAGKDGASSSADSEPVSDAFIQSHIPASHRPCHHAVGCSHHQERSSDPSHEPPKEVECMDCTHDGGAVCRAASCRE